MVILVFQKTQYMRRNRLKDERHVSCSVAQRRVCSIVVWFISTSSSHLNPQGRGFGELFIISHNAIQTNIHVSKKITRFVWNSRINRYRHVRDNDIVVNSCRFTSYSSE